MTTSAGTRRLVFSVLFGSAHRHGGTQHYEQIAKMLRFQHGNGFIVLTLGDLAKFRAIPLLAVGRSSLIGMNHILKRSKSLIGGVRYEIHGLRLLAVLVQVRLQVVFGDGLPESQLLIVGLLAARSLDQPPLFAIVLVMMHFIFLSWARWPGQQVERRSGPNS